MSGSAVSPAAAAICAIPRWHVGRSGTLRFRRASRIWRTSAAPTAPVLDGRRARIGARRVNCALERGREGLAEGVGFEPTIRFPVYTLSKRAPSATRPSLRERAQAISRPASILQPARSHHHWQAESAGTSGYPRRYLCSAEEAVGENVMGRGLLLW